MNDKPSRRRRNLLNDLADAITALELAGCPPEQADRVALAAGVAVINAACGFDAGAADGPPGGPEAGRPRRRDATARGADKPPSSGPERGWRDGRWMKLESESDTN